MMSPVGPSGGCLRRILGSTWIVNVPLILAGLQEVVRLPIGSTFTVVGLDPGCQATCTRARIWFLSSATGAVTGAVGWRLKSGGGWAWEPDIVGLFATASIVRVR